MTKPIDKITGALSTFLADNAAIQIGTTEWVIACDGETGTEYVSVKVSKKATKPTKTNPAFDVELATQAYAARKEAAELKELARKAK